jgi:hypothetical protein
MKTYDGQLRNLFRMGYREQERALAQADLGVVRRYVVAMKRAIDELDTKRDLYVAARNRALAALSARENGSSAPPDPGERKI